MGPEHHVRRGGKAGPERGGGGRNWGSPRHHLDSWVPAAARVRSESADASLSPSEALGKGGICLNWQPSQIQRKRKWASPNSGGTQSQHPPASGYCAHRCLPGIRLQKVTLPGATLLTAAPVPARPTRVTFSPLSLPCFFLPSAYHYLIYCTHDCMFSY